VPSVSGLNSLIRVICSSDGFDTLSQGDVGVVDQIEDAIRSNRIDSGDLKRLNPFAGAHM
jgi:hypothetical protein